MSDKYKAPPIDILKKSDNLINEKEINDKANKIRKTFLAFGIPIQVTNVTAGRLITRYCIKPNEGITISKIKGLKNDLQYNLGAERISIKPIKEKQVIAIDINNLKAQKLNLGDCIDNIENKMKIPIIIGKDMDGKIVKKDLAKISNILITGTTGTGKSNLLSSFIIDIVYNCDPIEVKLMLIDTRLVNFRRFNGISHLLIPTITNIEEVKNVLECLEQEVCNRYEMFEKENVNNLDEYNKKAQDKLPEIVAIIEDFGDLMLYDRKEIERDILKIINLSRAAGICLIISTARSSTDIITGEIKNNIPIRLTFRLPSQIDSKTVIDTKGAEELLTCGDSLFIGEEGHKLERIQTPYISDEEIDESIRFIKENNECKYDENLLKTMKEIEERKNNYYNEHEEDEKDDPLLEEVEKMLIDMDEISASNVQRMLKVGYIRASKIIDQLEEKGLISEHRGSQTRQVLYRELDIESENNEIESKNLEKNITKGKKQKDSIFNKWWFWILTIIFVMIIIGNM